jgi:hypothetical protein
VTRFVEQLKRIRGGNSSVPNRPKTSRSHVADLHPRVQQV